MNVLIECITTNCLIWKFIDAKPEDFLAFRKFYILF